jgi:hypothetical protein
MGYFINSVGGDSDGSDLLNYQFIPIAGSNPTKYNFCTPAPASTVVVTDPISFTDGEDFTFDLDGYKWKIKEWNVGTTNVGKWSNNHKPPLVDDDDGEKGTFTAQSGVEEDAKGKPAKAY